MVNNTPTPPIIICDEQGADLSIYRSVDDAALGLEPADVCNEHFVAFDSLGRLLKLEVVPAEGQRVRGLFAGGPREVVSIALVDGAPHHDSELLERLMTYLVASGEEALHLRESSLPDLLAKVQEHTRRSK